MTVMDIFVALADPTRRKILKMLSRRQMSAGDIADQFEMTQSAVSQHLKTLRDANLVSMQVDAQRRLYSFNVAGLKKFNQFLNEL
ncbi:MAG: metalloregulator ArsR/SmtB family transcription factor [Candidatus Obscuribacterales bacterium]|nr:metalloregulator ArsR/SmtB family transcription factor [Candidatus Obscuribacterales bacterium]